MAKAPQKIHGVIIIAHSVIFIQQIPRAAADNKKQTALPGLAGLTRTAERSKQMEWLKEILGDSYTDEIKKKLTDEIGKQFVSRADFNTTNETKKTLEAQIASRDKQLEELRKVDADGLQAEITRLTEENKKTQSDFDARLKEIKLETALETKLREAKAVNVRAVKALLDHEKISLDGDNLLGVDEQLKQLKEKEKWAFADSGAPGSGGNPAYRGGEEKKRPTGTVVI